MRAKVITCDVAVNESEATAVEHIKHQLRKIAGDDEWVLLTNLTFSVTHHFQSDEIDIIAIGPPGVRVIEVKHWKASWVDAHRDLVEQEADKLTNKARKIGTTLRRTFGDLPRVDGAFLLTRPPSKVRKIVEGSAVRGVSFHTLNQWKEAIGFNGPAVLAPNQVISLSRKLWPKSAVVLDGSLRRLAGYINLELQTPKDERFHRVYKGSHPSRRDRVILHLYDLSASDDKNAEARARREFDALHQLQLYSWAPRILDSWQDAPGYAGEMFFFTVVDPAAPTLKERAIDETWDSMNRLQYAREAVRALGELHSAGGSDEPLVHRNLTPATILVRHDNLPIFTGFERTRIPSDVSIASSSPPTSRHPECIAPEVRTQGLAVADQRSDVYSLCACLSGMFVGQSDDVGSRACDVLASGLSENPGDRSGLAQLEQRLSALLGESVPAAPAPPARFWTEDQVVRFQGSDYRIISRLGSGGIGTAFKVVEIDRSTNEELGTYVAKVAHDGENGERILKAYRLVRSHLGRHEALSPIYQIAHEWQENQFIALLGWIDGTPLNEFASVFGLLAEDQDEPTAEALALRWLHLLSDALDVLHSNGLSHGDVSPRNMIVSGPTLVLTDYDFVTRIGSQPMWVGTVNYCTPERQQKQPASPTDDLYALAASFFHVLFEKEPFRHGGELRKDRGLNWDGINRDEYPIIADILDQATHIEPDQRFPSAAEMRKALIPSRQVDGRSEQKDTGKGTDSLLGDRAKECARPQVRVDRREADDAVRPELSEQRLEWLKPLLQSYPGSRWGNRETRGLDTTFASETYVATPLEKSLLDDIRRRRVRLVILCGNAGDGKTALLQHIAQELGLGRHQSSSRILEGQVPNGPKVRMNLDGSAAWKGKTADEILDDFLAPFQYGAPDDDIVHLLAVNDGRLLEWIEGVKGRLNTETPLTNELYELLQQDSVAQESHVRFISLNQRSLVGGIAADHSRIETSFLDQLIDQLYGGARAEELWSVCSACTAKDHCRVIEAARVFGPDSIASPTLPEVRTHARQRLYEALQAVHLRGETHITVRELRAALVYVLFGIHFCDDYHHGESEPAPYWDRAFAADSLARQGEVLRELAWFDPALESHPHIDRYLLSQPRIDSTPKAPHYDGLALESARRRAYFEWTEDDIQRVAREVDALDLARGSHLKLFRELPLQHGADESAEITRKLCAGISRLENLPPQALDREGVVPMRITPRTPTETAFWVEKPLANFRIETDLPPEVEGIERLHRQVSLVYRYRDPGLGEERLRLGAELFHLLLELSEGYQLGDVSTDDTFAHLSIFVQRLVREDEREILAWNPMQDENIYSVAIESQQTPDGPRQIIKIDPIPGGATS